ncbi:unnamed protein product [Closterium sp. NIES-65]|nr:unnamed protein product [Closterium sp. NIES-65]
MEAVTRARLWLPELISLLGVTPKDLFNFDETALFPACQPRKTWALEVPVGGKIAKDRVVLLVDNAASHRVDSATALREDILGFRTVKLSNLRIVYLPPNTTAFTQPLDQGVIRAVKARFRQRVIADWLHRWDDSGSSGTRQTVKPKSWQMVMWVFESWDDVEPETIQRCWWHAGILPRAWIPLFPRNVTATTSDPAATSEQLDLLSTQLQRLNIGPAAMTALEFNSVDDQVPTCDFFGPDPLADEPPRTHGSPRADPVQPSGPADADMLRERRRVARNATEILIGYARASRILPMDLAQIFGISNSDVLARLDRASRAYLNLNNPPPSSGSYAVGDAQDATAVMDGFAEEAEWLRDF